MTLNTTMLVLDPVSPEALWSKANELIVPDDVAQPTPVIDMDEGDWVLTRNPAGMGLRALLWMYVRKPGTGKGLLYDYNHDSDEYETPGPDPRIPDCYAEIQWDTAYAYRGDNDEGCSGLHRRITGAMGTWLDSQGIDWIAQNEYTGNWAKCPMPDKG